MWETSVQSLGWEDLLEKGKATHSNILAWKSPWTIQSRTRLSDFHLHGPGSPRGEVNSGKMQAVCAEVPAKQSGASAWGLGGLPRGSEGGGIAICQEGVWASLVAQR